MKTNLIMKYLFTIAISTLVASCASSFISKTKDYQSMTDQFDNNELLGKWLTNSRRETYSYINFKSDGHFSTADTSNGRYTINKDSIWLYYPNTQPKGRLLKQTKDTLLILWGDKEAISYVRPEGV
ncbi:hypothetical protein [Nonlabens agnitus]|uniref:Lipocalin-like domain-containing protein n=1 Tax=Nonlabens agnitus TaxID=870484 RepID=A0A2S9WVD5_9FLAO|nr:hypothetical protein [Nonlabens agnitus]PRP67429.1 hypothetical protein BST86_10160 [Nonlabens agnitus]